MLKNYALAILLSFPILASSQNALSFDGIDDKVDLGNPPSLQLNGTTLTIEAWIYPTSWRTNVWEGGIVVKEQPIQAGYMFRAGQSGRLNFAFGSGGVGANWKELTTAANVLSLNVWQHVAATYDGTKVRLYKNGVRVDSTNYTGAVGVNTNSCVIGGWYSTGRNFPGKIDEVRIWNVVRTQAQIAASMNGEFCGAVPGLQAYFKFNQGTAGGNNAGLTTLTNAVGSNNGTLQGFALSGATSNWTTGASLTPGTGGSGTATVSACDSYTSPSGKVFTTSGTYVDTITSPLGCDSILTINLTVNQSNTGSMTVTSCNEYKGPSGTKSWTTSGTYTDIIPNSKGCDSVITVNLTINNVDIQVFQNGIVLTSWATGVTYQWLDCNNGYAAVPGATGQSFTPTASGSYAVQVNKAGCIDTSICYVVTGAGISEETPVPFKLFPNPTNSSLTIQWPFITDVTIKIFDNSGRLVLEETIENKNSAQLNLDLAKGIYIVQIEMDGEASYLMISVL